MQEWMAIFSVLIWIATSNKLAELMGCKVEKFPFVYLGLPQGARLMIKGFGK